MDFSKISSLVEKCRPLTELSSLPFIINSDGILKIRWFNYYLEQNDSKLNISIKSIFTTDESMKVSEKKDNLLLSTEIKDFDEPELNEREYLQLLANVFADYSENAMKALVSKAEMQPLLDAYNTVANYI